jgi:ankyrin repeat protein
MKEDSRACPILPSDILLQILPFVNEADWNHLSQACRSTNELCNSSMRYIYNTWKSSIGYSHPASLHAIAASRELLKLYILTRESDAEISSAVDDMHRSLLDLCVELKLYHFSRWLVSQGYKSSILSETMFNCIRAHDVVGASILLSCGIPIDRFRSRDDGMDVLTSSVLNGTVDLVRLFLENGVSTPEHIILDAIEHRGNDACVVDMVDALISLGKCDVNVTSLRGISAVQMALLKSDYCLPLLELLWVNGANISKRDETEGGGMTALDLAERKRRRNCYEFLEFKGAEHSLRYAVETGNPALIERCWGDADIPRGYTITEVFYSVCLAAAMGQSVSLRALLGHSLLSESINAIHYHNNMTPLHLAACRGHTPICRLLLDSGINPTAKAFGGVNLHMTAAALSGSPVWFNPADETPMGVILPPTVRHKTAAELAREAGCRKLGKMIDLFTIESEVVRRESEDSSPSSSSAQSPIISPTMRNL